MGALAPVLAFLLRPCVCINSAEVTGLLAPHVRIWFCDRFS